MGCRQVVRHLVLVQAFRRFESFHPRFKITLEQSGVIFLCKEWRTLTKVFALVGRKNRGSTLKGILIRKARDTCVNKVQVQDGELWANIQIYRALRRF